VSLALACKPSVVITIPFRRCELADGYKTREQLIGELRQLRQRITELGALEAERKQVEAVLKTHKELIDRILASTPNSVLVISQGSHIILANKTFYETFQMKKGEVEGRQLDGVVQVPELSDAVAEALAHNKPQANLEFRHKVGPSERVLLASISPMQNKEVLVTLQDVTEERGRQERLYLVDRLASVGEMAAGIAHELNNPLTSVVCLARLLIDMDIPSEIKDDLACICSETQRAIEVIRNLLSFSRKHESVKRPTQINKVIEDVIKLRAYEHRVNNIQVNTYFAPELPEITVDYFQMQQVFLNIILNAENAMIEARNQGTLSVATERVNNSVKISFTDDGPGIARESLNRIFDPFFTTKEIGKGSGLGLSICYGMVTQHGGSIYADSELGKGTTFVVKLPINPLHSLPRRMT
jgi:PAS domain S-box-containing protein